MSGHRSFDRARDGKRRYAVWQADSWNLFFGRGSHSVWNSENQHHLYDLLSVRGHGHDGRSHPRAGVFGHADDRIPVRRLRFSDLMDHDGISMESFTADPLYLVPHFMEHYVYGSCGLLYCGAEAY